MSQTLFGPGAVFYSTNRTKGIAFDPAGTAATTTTLTTTQTVNRTIIIPDSAGEFVTTDVAQDITAAKSFSAGWGVGTAAVPLGGLTPVHHVTLTAALITDVLNLYSTPIPNNAVATFTANIVGNNAANARALRSSVCVKNVAGVTTIVSTFDTWSSGDVAFGTLAAQWSVTGFFTLGLDVTGFVGAVNFRGTVSSAAGAL